MEKKIKKIISICTLVLIGLVLSLLTYKESFFTNIQVFHPRVLNKDFFNNPIAMGRVARGEFIAAYDNLGSIKLRVTTYNRHNYSTLILRFREKDSPDWDIINSYFVDRFPNGEFYTFGFPVIYDSAGRTYIFEFESDSVSSDNAIGFLPGVKNFASLYMFPAQSLLQNTDNLQEFIPLKLFSLIGDPYYLGHVTLFWLPIVIFFLKKNNKTTHSIYLKERLVLAGMYLIYIFNPAVILLDTILYITLVVFIVLRNQIAAAKITNYFYFRPITTDIFRFALFLSILTSFFIIFGIQIFAIRTALCVFYIMVLGVIFTTGEVSYVRVLNKIHIRKIANNNSK